MRLSKALNDKVMDIRLRDKLVADGSLPQSEVEKYLNELPDDGNNLAYTEEQASADYSTEQ